MRRYGILIASIILIILILVSIVADINHGHGPEEHTTNIIKIEGRV